MAVFICKCSTLSRIVDCCNIVFDIGMVILDPDDFVRRCYRENVRAYCEWNNIDKRSATYRALMGNDSQMKYLPPRRQYADCQLITAAECWLQQCKYASIQKKEQKHTIGDITVCGRENCIDSINSYFEMVTRHVASDLIERHFTSKEYQKITELYRNEKISAIDVIHFYMEKNNIRPIWR